MDNFSIAVTGESDLMLAAAISLGFSYQKHAIAYREDEKKGLVLYHSLPDAYEKLGIVKSLYPMQAEHVFSFVKPWLAQASLGRKPDHDGDNERGWHVYNESWGHISGDWRAFLAIRPIWAMYGK
jgi:hypothetical protein